MKLNVHVWYSTWFIGVSEMVLMPRKDLISSQGLEEMNDLRGTSLVAFWLAQFSITKRAPHNCLRQPHGGCEKQGLLHFIPRDHTMLEIFIRVKSFDTEILQDLRFSFALFFPDELITSRLTNTGSTH